tara:strand:- start:4530 stop:4766 length:237 start_codon:yes stop_codon:yes gene_type:complete
LPKFKQKKPEGLYVAVRNGDFNGALRRFKKKVSQDGILMEYKSKRYFEKPSTKKAKEKAAGIARHKKAMRRRMLEEGY